MSRTKCMLATILGGLVSLSVGCGGDEQVSSPTPDPTGESAWNIVQVGGLVNDGCLSRAVFEISSAQAIDFIAVNSSNLESSDMSLELFTMDQSGHRQLLSTKAITASSLDHREAAASSHSAAARNASSVDVAHTDSAVADSDVISTSRSQVTNAPRASGSDSSTATFVNPP